MPTRTYSSWYMYGEVTCMVTAVARVKRKARMTKRSSQESFAKVWYLIKTRPRSDMKEMPRSAHKTPFTKVSKLLEVG